MITRSDIPAPIAGSRRPRIGDGHRIARLVINPLVANGDPLVATGPRSAARPSRLDPSGGFAVTDGKLVEKTSGKGIKNEGQNGLKNDRGTIAMARTNDPNSAPAQFFINVNNNNALNYPSNGGYAVFGKVIEGMDVVDKIKAVATRTSPLAMRHPGTGEAED